MTASFALVTGASCGVGFALAEQFARHGYDLMVADAYDEIHTAAAALSVLGTDVEAVQVDLCCADNAYLLHRRVMSTHRPVSAVALTASVHDGLCLDGTLDSALDVVDASVRGTMLLARLQADQMVMHGGGGVILTAAPEEVMPGMEAAAYSASSAFLQAFAATLRDEVGESGVKVTTLMPRPDGAVGFTEMLSALLGRASDSEPANIARQAFARLTYNGRPGLAGWATDAMTTLAGRLLADRLKGPVRQIFSPTGEAV